MSVRAIIVYLVFVFALSWGLQIAAIQMVGDLENDAATPFLLAAMLVPTLVTLVFIVFHKPARSGVLWKPRWKSIPLALVAALVPAGIAFGVIAVATYAGWGHAGWFTFSDAGVLISGGPWVLGRGTEAWPMFIANVAATGILFALMNGVIAAGEEFGWRGFLQGKLIEQLGATRAIVLLGFLWSMWHLPAQLAGYNFPQTPVLGALVISPLELIAVSFFLGWLTLRAKSFIPAAIAHGSGNSIQEGVTANLHMNVPRLYEDLTTMALSMLIGLICWALIAGARKAVSIDVAAVPAE